MKTVKKLMQATYMIVVMLSFISCEKETLVDLEEFNQEDFDAVDVDTLSSKNLISGYWQRVDAPAFGDANRITVDGNGNPWIVTSFLWNIAVYDIELNRVFFLSTDVVGGGFINRAADIGAGRLGSLWITNSRNNIFYSNVSPDGPNFTRADGSARIVDVDDQGAAWVINNNLIYKRINGNNGSWTQETGAGVDIGIGGNRVYVIGTNKNLYLRRSNGGYDNLGGIVERVDVDSQGRAWVINSAGDIFINDGSGFQKLPGSAIDVGCSSRGDVYVIGSTDRKIYRWINQ